MADTFGLDKAARLAAKRAAQAAAEVEAVALLEPAFPFVVEAFNPLFFELEANPDDGL